MFFRNVGSILCPGTALCSEDGVWIQEVYSASVAVMV
jgi:hypothetical protein